MSTPLNILKGWFVTHAKPLQDQFWAWLDSFRHKDVKIVYDDLSDGLKGILESIGNIPVGPVVLEPGIFQFEVPEGILVEKLFILEPTNPTVKIGTTENGDEYMTERVMENGQLIYAYDEVFPEGGNLFFTGLTQNSIIKIFIR